MVYGISYEGELTMEWRVSGGNSMRVHAMRSLVDKEGHEVRASALQDDIITARASRDLSWDSKHVANILAHANWHTTEDINHVNLTDGCVLVATEDPHIIALGELSAYKSASFWFKHMYLKGSYM